MVVQPRFRILFAVVAVAVTILSWASAYPVVRLALLRMPPIPLAAARYAVAALLALVWLALKRPPWPRARDVPRILVCGGIGIGVYNILFNTGELTVSAGAASLLISAAPLMSSLIAVAFLGERLSFWGWGGSLLSFAGVAVIAMGQAGGLAFGSGATLVLGAALAAAIYTTMQKPLVGRYGALPTTAYNLLAGALLLSPWLPRAAAALATASSVTWIEVVELGVFPAAIGYAGWAYAVGKLGAARASGLLYLLPLTTLLLAYLLANEIPTTRTLLGGVVVTAGVVLMNTLGRRVRPSPAKAASAGTA
jgi:drug/metabolite transporter (DMT)-like permease